MGASPGRPSLGRHAVDELAVGLDDDERDALADRGGGVVDAEEPVLARDAEVGEARFVREAAALTAKMLPALPTNRQLLDHIRRHGLQKI